MSSLRLYNYSQFITQEIGLGPSHRVDTYKAQIYELVFFFITLRSWLLL